MPNISLIQKNGKYEYPATITEAVVDLNKRKKLSTILEDLSEKDFKGKVNQSTDISGLHDYKQGWHWIVNTAGRYVGKDCEVGDMIYCIQDFNALYQISDFEVLQSNVTYITNEQIDGLLYGYNPGSIIPYYKPEGGIPESDLNSELQNKIDSIDSLATVATTGDYNDLINTPDLSEKADKDSDAVEGNIAIFDNEGNPVDSGKTFPFTYADQYLTFEALEDTIFKFQDYTNNIQYSTDNGITWSEPAKQANVSVSAGSKVLWKGNMVSHQGIGRFRSEDSNGSRKKFNIEGNIMSLLYGDNFKGQSDISNKAYVFFDLFDYSYVVDASNLILPNTVSDHAYYYTFRQCSELTKPPKLSATVLAPYCYDCMFDSCAKLKEIPELPATTLAEGCYVGMFTNCGQLNGYVHLPAETLVNYCYQEMFSQVGRPIIKLEATNIIQGTFQNWSSTAIVIKKDNYDGISGNNVYTESEWEVVRRYELSSYYTKPNGGIPKSDLSTDVQSSLDKADSAMPNTTKYAGSQNVGGAANKAVSIPFGQVDSTSTATAFTATVDGITDLRDGVAVWLKNGVVKSSTSRWTLDINGLGAKYVVKSMQMSTNAGNTFDTNYAMLFVFDATQDVWMMNYGYYSDTNDIAYKFRAMNASRIAFNTIKANILVLSKDSSYVLAVNESGSTGTNKTLTTESFDPFGQIWIYNNGTIDIAPDGYVPNGYLWCQLGQIDARRSFNISTTEFEVRNDVYLVAVPQSDGSAKLHSSPITQTLPSTEDGLIYIYLGIANAAYQFDLYLKHPIYYYKNGALRQWTNQDTTAQKLGTSTIGGTTQGIFLNQGVPTACESYDMWYMKHIAALYGATRNDATGLWSYYYTKCARWDDTNEVIVWDRNIGYDDITDEEMRDMVNCRVVSLTGNYGTGTIINSRIVFHFRGYGNNTASSQPNVYINNTKITTYGYVGRGTKGEGIKYFGISLTDIGSLASNVRHLIGQCNSNADQAPTNANSLKLLEYVTMAPRKNNHTFNFGFFPNLEFVSVMYTVSHSEGLNYTGCKLILHPDVYAKIFDSTNPYYTLWHKIDLANQARTNPITIQSA